MNLILKKDFSFLYLNKSIYEKKYINNSIEDFNDFISFSLNQTNKYYILKIEKKKQEYEIEELTFEFLNYLNGVTYNGL